MQMCEAQSGFGSSEAEQRLRSQIETIVAAAVAEGDILRIAPHTKRLQNLSEATGLSEKSITDALILAAARAGIPIEIDCVGSSR
jgi:hypothetical protein